MIPPPIIQSTYTTPPPSASIIGKSTVFEHPIASDTREDELHADLQFLLDAQVEALAQGLESGKAGDGASTGSTTPTLNSVGLASRVQAVDQQRKD
jgi:hypothetical protein